MVFKFIIMKSSGFTIIELIIVVSVMAIMTAVLLVNWQPAEKALALRQATHQLSQDLRRTVQLSLAAGESHCSTLREQYNGFGIWTQDGGASYIIFENCTADYEWSGEASEDVLLQNITIGEDLRFQNTLPSSPVHVVFIPPEPTVFVNNSTSTNATFTVEIIGGSGSQQVEINPVGRIQVLP